MSYLSYSLRYLVGIIAAGMLIQSCVKPTSLEDIATEEGGGYTITGKLRPTGYVQDVIVIDSYAYLAQGQGGFGIVNIGDPYNPKLVSELLYETSGYSRKVAYVRDSTGTEVVYCADGAYGVASIDVTDKFHPTVPKRNLGYKPAISLLVFKKFLFTMINADGIAIAPYEDPKYPGVSVNFPVPGYGRSVCLSYDSIYALLAIGEGGVAMLNLSHLKTGTEIPQSLSGRLDLPGSAEYIVNIPGTNYACIACGPAGLQIIDYSDTSDIKLTGSFATGGFAKDLCVAGNRVYLATEKQGVQIIDISNIASPKRIGRVNLPDVRGIEVSKGYVYAADQYEGLIIIKIP
jgi:hypothetical protein